MQLSAQPMRMKMVLGLWSLWQFVIALYCRPVQDDYSYLDIGSNQGFSIYISDFWNSWGGNLSPSLIRIPFYLPSISGNQWWGIVLYSFLTSLLVLATSMILTTWLRGKSLKEFDFRDLILGVITCVGFEGIFSPGVLAAFVFGPASSTHLIPICSQIIGLWVCTLKNKNGVKNFGVLIVLFILGFIAGNCNFAEGIMAVITISLLLICHYIRGEMIFRLGFSNVKKMIVFATGTLFGFVTIVLSPGFMNRANTGAGLPSGFKEILIGFRSSFVSFSGDVVTHPAWIALTILIILFFKRELKEEVNSSRVLALIFLTTLCYLSLIIGTAFAYSAWHQSIGLLFLLTPSSLALAYLLMAFENIIVKISFIFRVSLGLLALLIPIMIIRVTVLEVKRGIAWDKNLLANYCLIGEADQQKLLGAEVRYPPIGLGIEDVNRWEWMSENYKKWLQSSTFEKKINCK